MEGFEQPTIYDVHFGKYTRQYTTVHVQLYKFPMATEQYDSPMISILEVKYRGPRSKMEQKYTPPSLSALHPPIALSPSHLFAKRSQKQPSPDEMITTAD